MYAIIKTGGKQHKVSVGDIIRVEKLDVKMGDETSFSPILVSADNKIDFNEKQDWTVKAKALAEHFFLDSGVGYTIFRSAPVFGPGDQFTTGLASLLKVAPGIFLVPCPRNF